MIIKKLNVNLSSINFSKISEELDFEISEFARKQKVSYVVAANSVLVNKTLLNYMGAS